MDFINIEEYTQLSSDYPFGITPSRVCRILHGDFQYEPGSIKAILLIRPAHRYIHAILSKSVNGWGESTGALSKIDLLYLYSMVLSFLIHLGYILVDYLQHQG